jgi:hypothetical protein
MEQGKGADQGANSGDVLEQNVSEHSEGLLTSQVGSGREHLPNCRVGTIRTVQHEGHPYRVTFGCFDNGRLGEIFFDVGKPNAALQAQANDLGILVSLLLQHQVEPQVIRRSVAGPVAAALDLWLAERKS